MSVQLQNAINGSTDLVSWVFSNQDYDQNLGVYIDAEDANRTISAAEARCTVRKLIAGFKAVGLQRGDCVCVHAFNDVMYPMFFLAIVGAGGVFTGSNPAYTASELSRHLHMTKARFLLSEPGLLSKVGTLIESVLPASRTFVFDKTAQDSPLSYRSWQELLAPGEVDWVTFSEHGEAKRTTVALLSTSGTSGLPKAAMISHHSMIMQTIMLDDLKQKPYPVSRLIALPVFHAFAFPIAHTCPLRDGTPTYMMRRMDLPRYMSIIQQYKITETAMVPPVVTSILKSSMKAYKLLRSLRTVWCAGAPLAQSTGNQMYRLLRPTARLLQWKRRQVITRHGSKVSVASSQRLYLHADCLCGLVYNGNTVEEDNMQAEIYVRGPLVMQGYLDNPQATQATKGGDGWLRTGDIAYRDQGKFYIVDRQKELIKVRGWQVSPAELEAQLLLHPSISNAAVIGVPSNPQADDETELPRAYVVRAPGEYLSEADIKAYMSTHLAKYKNLDGGVVFIDAIPKNTTGKILRSVLRERAATEARADTRALTISVIPPSDGPADLALPLSGLSLASTVSDSEPIHSSDASQPSSSDTDCSTHGGGDPDPPKETTTSCNKHTGTESGAVTPTPNAKGIGTVCPTPSMEADAQSKNIGIACHRHSLASSLDACEIPLPLSPGNDAGIKTHISESNEPF